MNQSSANRWKNAKQIPIEKFFELFPSDEACAEFVAKVRWPNGFVCPHCGSKSAWKLRSRPGQFKCSGVDKNGAACNRQTSVIAGTIMHGTKIPLRKWFMAAYFDMTHTNGISALQLQDLLELGSYKSAWLLLQKLRTVIVNRERTPLRGTVEVDEGFFPFRRKDSKRKGDSQIPVVFAIEILESRNSGRIRLQKVKDKSSDELRTFVLNNTEPGTTVITDANPSYGNLENRNHVVKNLSAPAALSPEIELPKVHRAIALCKLKLLGVYHGCREKHFEKYLKEFEFRWNRRRQKATIFKTLVQLCVEYDPVTYRDIVGDTSAWKRENRQRIYQLVNRGRLKEAKSKAREEGCDVFEILETLPPIQYSQYVRTPAKRPVLGKPKQRRS